MNDINEIKISDIIGILWSQRTKVFFILASFIIFSVAYALYLPNLYKSEVSLAPASDKVNGSLADKLGGLAAVAGINLTNSSGIDKTTLTIETLNSINFFDEIEKKYRLKPLIMAIDHWDSGTNQVIFDHKIFDEKNAKWVREVNYPKLPEPSLQETYRKFRELVKISQDEKTGVVNISVWHQSPTVSKRWADLLVYEINEKIRAMDIVDARKSIEYLTSEIENTTNAELKNTMYSLITEQYKKLTIANVKKEYALIVIDKAILADDKDKPKRALIVIFFTLIGVVVSFFVAFLSFRRV